MEYREPTRLFKFKLLFPFKSDINSLPCQDSNPRPAIGLSDKALTYQCVRWPAFNVKLYSLFKICNAQKWVNTFKPFTDLGTRNLNYLAESTNSHSELILLNGLPNISAFPSLLFYMLVLLVEYIFLTTFYGLYFNHQVLTCSWWPSVSSFHALPLHLSLWLVCTTNQLLIFPEKFSPLPRFEPGPPRNQANMLPTELSWLGYAFSSLFKIPPTLAWFPFSRISLLRAQVEG